MITEIGIAAGDIWQYMDANGGKASLKDLVKKIGKDKPLLLMSLGWLAREGHISLNAQKSDFVATLTRS